MKVRDFVLVLNVAGKSHIVEDCHVFHKTLNFNLEAIFEIAYDFISFMDLIPFSSKKLALSCNLTQYPNLVI